MKIFLTILALLATPAYAQTITNPTPMALVCAYNSAIPAPTNGQFAYVQCDNTGKVITAGAGGTPGGSSGQIQYNNAGAFGGFTASGDATIVASTGVVSVASVGGKPIGTSGATIPLLNTTNTVGAQWTFPAGSAANPSFVVGVGQTGLYSTGASTIGIAVGGVLKADYGINSAGAWTNQGAFTATGQIASQTVVQASNAFYLNAKAQIIPSAVSGSISLQNWAGGDWGLLQFGGTTASFPALKRNLTALNVRLADDSGDAPITAASISTSSTTLHTTTVALANGAAAGAGTLTNAPSSGNPTKWVPINDNGTTRYIPAW